MSKHRLFHEFAHRYDLHTPPGHYQHDHAFVISEALRHAPGDCRLLDVGCGTGVFLEAAIAAGIDGRGIDASPEMIDVARARLGSDRVGIQRMQDLAGIDEYDVICFLSWTIHYCESLDILRDVVTRCGHALRPGGVLLLQVANDEQMGGSVNVDREPGPDGTPDDILLVHRFRPLRDSEHAVDATYVYVSVPHNELAIDHHRLLFAAPCLVTEALRQCGFDDVSVMNENSVAPFVRAVRDLTAAR